MQRLTMMIVAAIGISSPVIASAQTANRSDLAYCNALSDLYVRYIGHDLDWGRQSRRMSPLDGQVAVAQCRQGQASAAIPVLEQKLLAQKFTLPARG